MRGRPAIPNAIKRLAGDGLRDSGGRIIGDELKAMPGPPATPKELTGDALTAWHAFLTDTLGMDILTHADRGALIILCETWAHMRGALAMIRAEGLIVECPNGITAAHPAIKIYRESASMVLKLLGEFGCSPSARARIKLAPTTLSNDIAEEFPELS